MRKKPTLDEALQEFTARKEAFDALLNKTETARRAFRWAEQCCENAFNNYKFEKISYEEYSEYVEKMYRTLQELRIQKDDLYSAKRKFKKAERVYTKLQKKAEKENPENSWMNF